MISLNNSGHDDGDDEPEDTSEVVVWTSTDLAMWKEIFAEAFAPPPPEPWRRPQSKKPGRLSPNEAGFSTLSTFTSAATRVRLG